MHRCKKKCIPTDQRQKNHFRKEYFKLKTSREILIKFFPFDFLKSKFINPYMSKSRPRQWYKSLTKMLNLLLFKGNFKIISYFWSRA